jgi:hypothetical protein
VHPTETEAEKVPADLVLSSATFPLAYDRNLRLLVARLAALRATRRPKAQRLRVPSQSASRRGGCGDAAAPRTR